jgi:hypothetical protein
MKVVNKGYGIDCAAGKPQSSSRSAAAETGGQGEAQIFGEEVKSLFSLVVGSNECSVVEPAVEQDLGGADAMDQFDAMDSAENPARGGAEQD